MEQNQPFKKRMLEQQPCFSPVPYDGSQNQQRLVQHVQYIQYIPANECKIETTQQQQPQIQSHLQRPTPAGASVVKLEHYEAPMMLNAWTQTNSDDFPPLTSKNEATLLANIKHLEQQLKSQTELINQMQQSQTKSPTPIRVVSQSNVSANSESSPVPVEYRIINKTNGPNNETQIEIEISDETECPEEIVEDQKENEIIEHMYAQIASTPSSVATTCKTEVEEYLPETKKPIVDSDSKTPNSKSPPDASKKQINIAKGPYMSIGPNDTKVPATEFEKITWSSASIATRKLLGCIFDRETLATHSMTGKASPAFKDLDKPIKRKLDSKVIEDIIFVVTTKCGVSSKEVRSAITTKCADENKMLKLKALKNIDSKRSILTDFNRKQK